MSRLIMQCVESKDSSSFANQNESLMVYSFDVRGVNTGTRNLLVCIMVMSLLLEESVEEKGSDQRMVCVPQPDHIIYHDKGHCTEIKAVVVKHGDLFFIFHILQNVFKFLQLIFIITFEFFVIIQLKQFKLGIAIQHLRLSFKIF